MALDRTLAWLTELPAAALLVVEVCVLFIGVTSRYVFDQPTVWSDPLASVLFLWLAMLGAVVGLRRDKHMCLHAVVKRLPERHRRLIATVATGIVAVFLLEIITPAVDYTSQQWDIITPTLRLHDAYRVGAIVVGAVLMIVVALARLAQESSLRDVVIAAALLSGVALILWVASPVLVGMGNYNLIVFFVGIVVVCILMSVPIAFAFGIATFSYLALMTDVPLMVLVSRMDEGLSNLMLLAIPLFVFLGLLIEATGLARVLVAFMLKLLGHVRGGLSYVLLVSMYLVSGVSGAKIADMAAVAPALFPEMKRRGAEPGDLVALLSASAAMAETIPPSVVLIIIGSVTGVSISALFTGGWLPAAVGAVMLTIVVVYRARRLPLLNIKRPPLREIGRGFVVALPALILPLLIRTLVAEGVATATEVSTLGIVYTIAVALAIYRPFNWKQLYPMLVETAGLSGAILFITGTATAMAWALTQSGFAGQLVTALAHAPGGKAGFWAFSIILFVVLGSVLEGIPAIVLFGPLLFPVARAIGVSEVQYAMVVILGMGLGLYSPPFGLGFYVACAIGNVPPEVAIRRVWPYLAALLIALILVASVPWLSIGFL